jgi:hypothetical protein
VRDTKNWCAAESGAGDHDYLCTGSRSSPSVASLIDITDDRRGDNDFRRANADNTMTLCNR